MKDNDILEEAKKLFKVCQDTNEDNYQNAKNDIEFGMIGKQWDDADVKSRALKGKPCLTINKLPSYMRQVINDARQNKPAIVVNPVDSESDPDTAEILNGLIRNIEVTSKADIAYDNAITQAVTGGFGYIRVGVEFAYDDTFDKDITIEPITNQFSVYGDPYSTMPDGSDWNHCFLWEMMTKDDFKDKYGDKAMGSWETMTDYTELSAPWAGDDSVMICEYWCRKKITRKICQLSDGSVVDSDVYDEHAEEYQILGLTKVQERETQSYKVTQYILTGAEVLEKNEWAGKYIPIVPCYGDEVWLEGERHLKSQIRDAKDAQKQFNYWRSTATEEAARHGKSTVMGKVGTFNTDSHKWATLGAIDHAYVQYDGMEPPIIIPPTMGSAAALQEAMNSSEDIQATMGMFNASIGAQGNEKSGKAIIARQRESDTGTFHFIDNLSRCIRHVGCIVVDLIPHVYNGNRVIRVLGEDKKEIKNVQLSNEPSESVDNETGEIVKIYDLSLGKYDVTVTAGASYSTMRQEAASQMIEMMRINPSASQIMGDLLAKNLDWPGAEEIAERFKAMLPPQLQDQNPQVMQLQQQLQLTQQQAQGMIGQLQKQLNDMKNDKSIDAYNAETNRLKAFQVGMTPDQVQVLVLQTVQNLLNSPDILPSNNGMMQTQQMQMPTNTEPMQQ